MLLSVPDTSLSSYKPLSFPLSITCDWCSLGWFEINNLFASASSAFPVSLHHHSWLHWYFGYAVALLSLKGQDLYLYPH